MQTSALDFQRAYTATAHTLWRWRDTSTLNRWQAQALPKQSMDMANFANDRQA
jgi:hypothetical protein